jgi:hypothetical protein
MENKNIGNIQYQFRRSPRVCGFSFWLVERVTVVVIVINELDLYNNDDRCFLGSSDQTF